MDRAYRTAGKREIYKSISEKLKGIQRIREPEVGKRIIVTRILKSQIF
jgi:hypothetical protein